METNNDLKPSITPIFLGSQSIVTFERLSYSKIHALFVRIYLQLLSPQNILHIQQFYPVVVKELLKHFAILRAHLESGILSETPAFKDSQHILNLLLAAIYPLCTLRNSFLV